MNTTPPGVLDELDDIATLFDYQDYRDKIASIRTRVAALVEACGPIEDYLRDRENSAECEVSRIYAPNEEMNLLIPFASSLKAVKG